MVPLGLLILFVLAFWGLYTLTRNVAKTPTIEITSGNEVVTDQTEVPVTGVVKNASKLTVDGEEVSLAEDGSFSAVVPVSVGENNVEIVAGDGTQTKASVRITREEPEPAITATSTTVDTTAAGVDLTTSGPAEVALGSVGLAAILVAFSVYYRSLRQNFLQAV